MKVSLFRDKLWVFKSGINSAFNHQEAALRKVGVDVDTEKSADSSIVHFNWYSPLSRWMLGRIKRRGKKAVVFAHSANDLRGSFNLSNLFEPLLRRYLASFYSKGDLLITPSAYCKQLLQSDGYGIKSPIHVISNGVDTEKFVFCEDKRQEYRRKFGLHGPTVVTAGQFIPRKGVIDFIETARLLPEYTFLWFGPITNKLFSFSREMRKALRNKPDNVVIAGFVDDIVAALCCGDVFFFPSFEENQGIALLEAACIGLPIVLRPIPVYEGWLTPDTSCLAGNTPEDFARHIESVYGDSRLRARLTSAATEMAHSHNLQSIGEQLVALYRKEFQLEVGAASENVVPQE